MHRGCWRGGFPGISLAHLLSKSRLW
jgi:hypothetical protein